jgi:hypothetical protein
MSGGFFGGLFFLSIGFFDSVAMMLVGQVFLAIFLAILLGLGISYFQDILPDFPGVCFHACLLMPWLSGSCVVICSEVL